MFHIKKFFKPATIAIATLILFTACDPMDKYAKEEKALLQDYLSNHPDYQFELKTSGLYYMDVVAGTGRQPVTHDTASVLYTGYYLDGKVLGTNVGGDTLVYPVNENNLLPGFEEAVMYMKEGGKCRALLNSDLGYGNSGLYFPAYTPVVFEIQLLNIVPGPGK